MVKREHKLIVINQYLASIYESLEQVEPDKGYNVFSEWTDRLGNKYSDGLRIFGKSLIEAKQHVGTPYVVSYIEKQERENGNHTCVDRLYDKIMEHQRLKEQA